MSFIGKNIKRIRTVKKLSQAKFAELFNLARPSVGAYEEGRAEPKIQTVIEIAHYFGLSVDILLTKELTVNDLYSFNVLNEKLDDFHGAGNASQAIAKTGSIALVKAHQQLEYLVNFKNRDFLNKLATINLPFSFKEQPRAFEMTGSHMEYKQAGLHHGDVLLCGKLPKEKWKKASQGQVLLVVAKKELIVRRLKKVGGEAFLLAADDPNYDLLELPLSEVLEVWLVKGFYSTHLDPPQMLEEKMLLMEESLKKLMERVEKVEGKKG